jgi:RHS repeat-associated protein
MRKITAQLALIALISFIQIQLSATPQTTVQSISGSQVVSSSTPHVLSDIYYGVNMSGQAHIEQSLITIKLEFDQQVNNYISGDHTYKVTLTPVYNLDFNGVQSTTSPGNIVLEVAYKDGDQYTSHDMYTVLGYNRVSYTISSVEVDGASGTFPSNLRLSAELTIDRYYLMDVNYSFQQNQPQHSYLSSSEELEINWPVIPGAESYDLEWTYVNDYDEVSNSYLSSSDVNYDFSSSTRINTGNTSYRISLVFDHGYVIYRLRGVGVDLSNTEYYLFTPWSLPSDGSISSINTGTYVAIDGSPIPVHEQSKNWQYSATYAEDGKKKEVISYYDGSLRNRQTVSRINSQNQAVVGETVYDYQGRPAVQILPVPIEDNSTLRYYADLNLATKNSITQAFNYQHFDMDGSTCQSSLTPLNTTAGAAYYYSANNTDNSGAQAFLPHAFGYPFSQTEYTPDNTGRIRRQGGVGVSHQLGANVNSDKSTRYYYGTPEQEELDRLFGSEVGNNNHYKKNMVVDPNGQVSVSYLDASGHVIATSLAGTAPANVNSLSYDNQSITTTLIGKNSYGNNPNHVEDNALVFSKSLLVPQAGDYTFSYEVDIEKYNDLCPGCDFCLDCVYDLSISIKDACGNEMISGGPFTTTIGNSDNTECDVTTTQSIQSIVVNLPIGSYTVEKNLSVNQGALDAYLNEYLKSSGCVRVLNEFVTEATTAADGQSDCDISCSECVSSLGATYTAHVSIHGSSAMSESEYNQALSECNAPCTYNSTCDNLYEAMLGDVSPGGQYAMYKSNSGTIDASTYPLSLFNAGGYLPKLYSASSTYSPAWRHPIVNGSVGHYKDAAGYNYYLLLHQLPNGDYYPEVDNAANIETVEQLSNGSYQPSASGTIQAVKPEHLLHLEDFIALWDPLWAHQLVEYHPEYGYYTICGEIQAYNYNSQSSKEFDASLYDYESFDDAVNNLPFSDDQSVNDLFANDPYFAQFTSGDWQYDQMESKLDDFDGDHHHNLKQVVALSVMCGGVHTTPNSSCYDFGTSNSPSTEQLNTMWQRYRDFYLAEKNRIQTLQMQYYASGFSPSGTGTGYNGCMDLEDANGNTVRNFNVRKIWFYQTTLSQLQIKPAISATFPYYESKKRRFIDVSEMSPLNADYSSNASAALNELLALNQVGYYSQSGQCMSGIHLQGLLNELIARNIFTTTSAEALDSYSTFTQQLYDASRTYQGVGNESDYFEWLATNVTSSQLRGNVRGINNSIAGITLELNTLNGVSIDWTEALSFSDIQYLSNGSGLYYFRALLRLSDNSQRLVYGNTSLPLNDCLDANGDPTFEQCLPTALAYDIQTLLSVIAANGDYTNSAVNLMVSSTYAPFITDEIKAHLGAAGLFWYGNSTQLSGSAQTMTLSISNTQSSSYINGFSNIKPHSSNSGNNYFSIRVLYNSSSPISSEAVNGSASLTSSNPDMILCTSTVSTPCGLPENNNMRSLEKVLNQIARGQSSALTSSTAIDIESYQGLSTLIPYLPQKTQTGDYYRFLATSSTQGCEPSSSATSYTSYLTSNELECCEINLSCSSSITWANIIGFSNMQCSTNTAGEISYHFTITAHLNTGSTVSLSGYTSCIPLANCCDEPPLAPLGQSLAASKFATYAGIYNTSTASDFYITEEDFHLLNLGQVSENYDYYVDELLNSMLQIDLLSDPENAATSSYFISLPAFYSLNPSQDVIDDYFELLTALEDVYTNNSSNWGGVSFDENSLHFILPVDFFIRGYAESSMPTSTSGLFIDAYISYLSNFGVNGNTPYELLTLEQYARNNGVEIRRNLPCPALPQVSMPLFPEEAEDTPCEDFVSNLINANAQLAYDRYLEDLKADFSKAYIEKCLQAGEAFEVLFNMNEYHFTLYYYDQVGNLVKTIPPAGVHPIKPNGSVGTENYPSNVYARINQERNTYATGASTRTIRTYHTLATTYEYNSLNQLVKQNTPDGGSSNFWYDALGRLVVSQNAQQAEEGKYSYTVYDPVLGRIEEVGEIQNATAMTYATARNQALLDTWLGNGTQEEITYTLYDDAASITGENSVSYSLSSQANLRGRVAAVYTDEDDDTYAEHITFYSYDIHGNVDRIKQVNPFFDAHEEKLIEYEYDLVSGNVNTVYYQRNQKDQFIQRYEYDGDNRITNVWTSRDNVLWQQQAKYYYYQHGPLARVETANDKVQGIDYAYTIQGWLKNVNSDNLDVNFDMGKDGKYAGEGYLGSANNIHAGVASDAFGFSLSYFDGDYTPIKQQVYGGSNISPISDMGNITDLTTASPELYNGNIRAMVTALFEDATGFTARPQLTAYNYDQLNRIAGMETYEDMDAGTNSWNSGSLSSQSKYNTSYTYDAMGNILSLDRKEHDESDLDELRYTYNYDSYGFLTNNRLQTVEDNVGTTTSSTDFEGSSNYTYDAIGNLISDSGEEIDAIAWTVTGKVKSVTRNSSSSRSDLVFAYDAMGNRISKTEKMRNGSGYTGETKTTYYMRDASGNVMATYWESLGGDEDQQRLDELMIYGSSRLGMLKEDKKLVDLPEIDLSSLGSMQTTYTRGNTYFELSNHARKCVSRVEVVTDRKLAQPDGSGGIDFYRPDIVSSSDYYPFGFEMNERGFSSDYRYGFNGMEKDDEMKGSGKSYDFGARIYDPRLGRWLAVDNYREGYPNLSTYNFAANSPLIFLDIDGNVLRDANGNIIYTKQKANPIPKPLNSKRTLWAIAEPVWIYDDSGKKHQALLVKVYEGTVDPNTGTLTITKEVTDEGKNINYTYDCHGQSQTDGAFFIDSGTPIEGILKGDRENKLQEFSDFSAAKEGDIAIFRDATGKIVHTATVNADGTLTSKNGGYVDEVSNAKLADLKKEYPNTVVTFTVKNVDYTLETLHNQGENGRAEYSESEVQTAVKEQSQIEKNRKEAKEKSKNPEGGHRGAAGTEGTSHPDP